MGSHDISAAGAPLPLRRAGLAALLCAGTAVGGAGPACAQKYDGSGPPTLVPHTLQQAMAYAYLNNPTLKAERANLRSVDEDVPTALAGWRPTVSITASESYYDGNSHYTSRGVDAAGRPISQNTLLPLHAFGHSVSGTINQPLYSGGRTTATTHQAVNRVMSERATLLATEQQVMLNVVNSYISVVLDQQLVQLNTNNEKVLEEQVRATTDRFRVGEITRTDVAQAESALATARAQRQQSEGTLQTAIATYTQYVGAPPAPNLEPPQPLTLPVRTQKDAIALAGENNPNVVAALFAESAAKDQVDVAFAALMPKLSLQGQAYDTQNQGQAGYSSRGLAALVQLQMPIYQGGSEYAAVRQARQTAEQAHRQVDVQRREAVQQTVAAWQNLTAYRASIESSRAAIRAGVVALDGVERQAIVGTSTTLEVLQQQQTLLTAQVSLVQALSNMVYASYQAAQAAGRLTARDLHLNVPLYDDTAYYNAVKNRLWGTGDYALTQPGR